MGIPPQGPNNTYLTAPLKSNHLWPHHRRMVRLVAEGLQISEICSLTGFTEGALTRILATPHFQAEVQRLVDKAEEAAVDVRGELQQMAPEASAVLAEDLTMEIHDLQERKHRSAVARDILDRVGISAGSKIPSGGIHFHKHKHEAKEMTDEQLRDDVMDLTRAEDGSFEST